MRISRNRLELGKEVNEQLKHTEASISHVLNMTEIVNNI